VSEVINNRQQRVDIMKELIRRLHAGSHEDLIKSQLESLLREADYGDVFLMEVQLIQEGIPAESIQQLCDTHTRVLKKHLDLQETPDTTPGHPVHTFVQENRELTRTTGGIRVAVQTLESVPDDVDVTEQVREIQLQLNNLMDVDKHYRRKENLLFPYFEKNQISGPPTVMWGKHDAVRESLRETIAGLNEISTIRAAEARAYALFAITPSIEGVEEMIYKEEKILFPVALTLLTDQDWYDIAVQSDEYGYCLFVPEFAWTPAGMAPPAGQAPDHGAGRIHMPTGSFSLEELLGVFQTMPFDVTFVDKDDTVRYFSPGRERIFDRSRAILGRKVQYCHPPKSVHIVNQIVRDFKEGKQDRARFWISMKGRRIYICYYAVRNGQGEYLGTLEVTQDVTELKDLEGERRLLTYDTDTQDQKRRE
jgi:DUF438 domain-containing protein